MTSSRPLTAKSATYDRPHPRTQQNDVVIATEHTRPRVESGHPRRQSSPMVAIDRRGLAKSFGRAEPHGGLDLVRLWYRLLFP